MEASFHCFHLNGVDHFHKDGHIRLSSDNVHHDARAGQDQEGRHHLVSVKIQLELVDHEQAHHEEVSELLRAPQPEVNAEHGPSVLNQLGRLNHGDQHGRDDHGYPHPIAYARE